MGAAAFAPFRDYPSEVVVGHGIRQLGVGLWTYAAFRLVPPLIGAALVGWALTRRAYWRRIGIGIAVAAAVALVVASPLIRVAVDDPGQGHRCAPKRRRFSRTSPRAGACIHWLHKRDEHTV